MKRRWEVKLNAWSPFLEIWQQLWENLTEPRIRYHMFALLILSLVLLWLNHMSTCSARSKVTNNNDLKKRLFLFYLSFYREAELLSWWELCSLLFNYTKAQQFNKIKYLDLWKTTYLHHSFYMGNSFWIHLVDPWMLLPCNSNMMCFWLGCSQFLHVYLVKINKVIIITYNYRNNQIDIDSWSRS